LVLSLIWVFIYGFAAMQFEKSGTSSMIWFVLAYLFHTIGSFVFRLASFITKLSPVKYASLMMEFILRQQVLETRLQVSLENLQVA
jgi:POT family proton-dependent oligopeptide transporter